MNTIWKALFLLMALVHPVMAETPGGASLDNPKLDINLSLDLNSRVLVDEAVTESETSVSAVIYKFDDPKLVPVFKAALDRGVHLKLLCDGKQAAKKGSLVASLKKAGAEVRMWPSAQGKLHAKFMICDEDRVLSGSWNLTKSAGQGNVEILMDFRGEKVVTRFEELFARLWAVGQPTKD